MRKRTCLKGIAAPFANQIKAAVNAENVTLEIKILRESLVQPVKVFLGDNTITVPNHTIFVHDFVDVFRATAKNIVGFDADDVIASLMKTGAELGIRIEGISCGYVVQAVLCNREWIKKNETVEIVPISIASTDMARQSKGKIVDANDVIQGDSNGETPAENK